jgi:hypothetical protein
VESHQGIEYENWPRNDGLRQLRIGFRVGQLRRRNGAMEGPKVEIYARLKRELFEALLHDAERIFLIDVDDFATP